MVIWAFIFCLAFVLGFAFLVRDALRSGRLRGLGWSVEETDAPIRYWVGVVAYSLNFVVALLFLMILTPLLVR